MGLNKKFLLKLLSGLSDKNIEFRELRKLMIDFGFKERIKGDHHIFIKADVLEILNLQPLKDGNNVVLGPISLKVIHTPGHTPGSICLYYPGHVFTGDTLFVKAVGRTDLPGGSWETLIKSIKTRLFTLPEETIVWPGHDYGEKPNSTIGEEKRFNPFIK